MGPILQSSQALADVNEQDWKNVMPRKMRKPADWKAKLDGRPAYNGSHAVMTYKGDATKSKTLLKTSKEIPWAGQYGKFMNSTEQEEEEKVVLESKEEEDTVVEDGKVNERKTRKPKKNKKNQTKHKNN